MSLQIWLRPINLMLSIFVKIYCLLLSKFDIVMQFVSHFGPNCDVLKTVDRPSHMARNKQGDKLIKIPVLYGYVPELAVYLN